MFTVFIPGIPVAGGGNAMWIGGNAIVNPKGLQSPSHDRPQYAVGVSDELVRNGIAWTVRMNVQSPRRDCAPEREGSDIAQVYKPPPLSLPLSFSLHQHPLNTHSLPNILSTSISSLYWQPLLSVHQYLASLRRVQPALASQPPEFTRLNLSVIIDISKYIRLSPHLSSTPIAIYAT